MDTFGKRAGRALLVLGAVFVALVVGWTVFVRVPRDVADLLGVLLVLGLGVVVSRAAARAGRRWFAAYDVAEVAVEGPISRDGSTGGVTGGVVTPPADAVVEQIERADDDRNVEGLLVALNTPGGEIVPSDDIRLAVERFDGPVVAYATDQCASGGYWIASACDRLFAREGSLVGSIGVIGSTVNATELAEELGVSYERFAAGKYKDAGQPLKKLDEDDRSYLQGIVDDYYDDFVERVAAGRGLDPETVRETEARVFLGTEAESRGLVDEIGTARDAEDALADELGHEVTVEAFHASPGLIRRLQGGGRALARAAGAGVADALAGEDDGEFRLR
ncbi:protease-4 [Halarchaeum solikamskense]|uniref:signal peptide peptidase SppA n=1 Tax=Halarchaeum nitratireducens TaxID=489913 RepID=UPI001B3ADD25|nr:signal peptide peptidase SppA [Halarchaeum solikamskense]MBP2251550.1 protease-4 [Halarchaeum solikamskense]